MNQSPDDLEQLAAHVRYRIGAVHVYRCQQWRVDALTAMVVRHWPHAHLDAVLHHGRNHKAVHHAMVLVRAQVREQWEARHGVGPLWSLALAPAVGGISHVLLDLWFSTPQWRGAMRALSRRVPEGESI